MRSSSTGPSRRANSAAETRQSGLSMASRTSAIPSADPRRTSSSSTSRHARVSWLRVARSSRNRCLSLSSSPGSVAVSRGAAGDPSFRGRTLPPAGARSSRVPASSARGLTSDAPRGTSAADASGFPYSRREPNHVPAKKATMATRSRGAYFFTIPRRQAITSPGVRQGPVTPRPSARTTSCTGRRASDALEVALALPVGHGALVGLPLRAEEVGVVLDDFRAEDGLGEGARLEAGQRVAQVARDARELARRVEVALEARRRLELLLDAVEARGERGGEGEVRIGVRAGDAALDAECLSVADHAEAGRAVVVAPGEARRGPRGALVALVAVHVGRVEGHQLRSVRDPAGQHVAEEGRAAHGAAGLVAGEGAVAAGRARAVREAQVDVAARAGLLGRHLGHEGQREPVLIGQLLQALLVDRVAIGHRERVGVAHVELVLAEPPLALRVLDRDAGGREMPPRGGMERFGARTLAQVVVLERE